MKANFHLTVMRDVRLVAIGGALCCGATSYSSRAQDSCPLFPNALNKTATDGIVAHDFDGDGFIDVAAVKGGSSPGAVDLWFNRGNSTFELRQTVPVGIGASAIAGGDIDGDGDSDVVTTNYNSNTVSIVHNLGNMFGSALTVAAGPAPKALTVTDLNLDGRLDIIVCNATLPARLGVLTQGPSGAFSVNATYTPGTHIHFVDVGDMTGDGFPDIVLGVQQSGAPYLSLMVNDGQGLLQSATPLKIGSTPFSPHLGDIDGDGDLDIVAKSGGIHYLINNGQGRFDSHVQLVPSTGSLHLADVDRDGDLDMLSSEPYNLEAVTTLLNDGDGVFSAIAPCCFTGYEQQVVESGDFNNDGQVDLLTMNIARKGFSVVPGIGGGIFRGYDVVYDYPNTFCTTIQVVDVNGDAIQDLVSGLWGQLGVFIGLGGGTFAAPVVFDPPGIVSTIQTGDLEGDGDVDLVVSSGDTWFSVMLNNGVGHFGTPVVYQAWSNGITREPAVCDFDGDGRADIAMPLDMLDNGASQLKLYHTNIDGSLTAPSTLTVGSHPCFAIAGDLDGDRDNELVVVNYGSNNVSVFRNQGGGSLVLASTPSLQARPTSAALGDLDGDADLDLAVTTADPSQIRVLRNDGNCVFSLQAGVATDSNPSMIDLVDANGDGWLDAVITFNTREKFAVHLNDRAGHLDTGVQHACANDPWDLGHSDFDGDGAIDLVVSFGEGKITIFKHLGETANVLVPVAPFVAVAGEDMHLQISAQGSAPLVYQWRKDGLALIDGGAVGGTHTNMLTVSPVSSADAGFYDVVVSNGSCLNVAQAGQIVVLPYCRNDVAGSNGVVSVDDLLVIIGNWGPCPVTPMACVADVIADGRVDVNDLISVITNWGPCP